MSAPKSEAALVRALQLDPSHPVGRYYSALTLLQEGRPDLGPQIFAGLVDRGPARRALDAAARAGLAEAEPPARLAHLAALPDAARAQAPPTSTPLPTMSPEERQAMIEGMVAQLGDRLASEGGPPEDWAQLIRALGVLGQHDKAEAIAAEARTTYAGDPAALAAIDAAARGAAGP